MTNWIKHPLILEGEKVKLVPLSEQYFDELIRLSNDEIIWTYMPVKGTDKEKLLSALNEALIKRDNSEQYPFVVINKVTGKVMGSTRYLHLNEEHRNLEIGYTWYLPEFWGKGYNEECKYLLLRHCFEVLKTIRVQIITSNKNLRSRKAIERVGGKFEGVLRDVVIRNDDKRSIAYYSIIEEEWNDVKQMLPKLYEDKYSNL
jgi:RimJ/RimL family protein N-acetyltransferase